VTLCFRGFSGRIPRFALNTGEMDMGDRGGSKDKGKREKQKQAQLTPKEKKKVKAEKKKKK
jgi:hypothetical protein